MRRGINKKKTAADENARASRAAVFVTGSQPKALAVTSDNTVFVVGVEAVEAVRNNQKVAELRPAGASASAIAAAGSLVAIGFGVGCKAVRAHRGVCSPAPRPAFLVIHHDHDFFFLLQDQKVRLYNWDGKGFQEAAILEGNKGLVSALAFSPDGLKLAAGDVSTSSEFNCHLSYG